MWKEEGELSVGQVEFESQSSWIDLEATTGFSQRGQGQSSGVLVFDLLIFVFSSFFLNYCDS